MSFEDFFDYPKLIGELNLKQKQIFYTYLAHNLTVSVRGVRLNGKLTDSQKVEGMKLINEIMHRLVLRIAELHKIEEIEDDSWTEADFWEMIKDWVSENYQVVAGEVGWAIKTSYNLAVSSKNL